MVYQKQVFPLEKPAHFYIRMRGYCPKKCV